MKVAKKSYKYYFFISLFLSFLSITSLHIAQADNLVSNVDGKIRVVILHYGIERAGGFWFDQTIFIRDLMNKMDKDVAFVVLVCDDVNGDRVKEILQPYSREKLPDGTTRVKYLTVDAKTSRFYPWARDPYMILTDNQGNLIFLDAGYNEPPFPITNFHDVFAHAKSQAGSIHRGGGNIRTTNEEMIIGMDTLLGLKIFPRWVKYENVETLYSLAKDADFENLPAFKARFDAYCNFIHTVLAPDKKMVIPGKEEFFARLERQNFPFTKKTVWDTGAQPAYHTDVYLGLGHIDEAGKRIIFIADSKSGAQVVEKMSPAERRQVEQNLPALLEAERLTAAGVPLTKEQISERFQWEKHKLLDPCLEKSHKIAEKLDKAANHLEELGYHVIRIPYLPNGLDNSGRNDDVMGIGFNYSNILTEVYGGIMKVYMPAFGFKQLDEAAAQAYRDAGFQTIIIKGLIVPGFTTGDANAGLDCLTSEIRFPVRWANKYYEKQ
jgi:hypothetical protein